MGWIINVVFSGKTIFILLCFFRLENAYFTAKMVQI